MDKQRQQELGAILFGDKYEPEKINGMTMNELITIQQTAVHLMAMNRNDEKKFKFMDARAKFFFIQVLERLKNAEEIYAIFSPTHNLPFVACDEKTFDDQIYIFTTEEETKRMIDAFGERKIVLKAQKIIKEQLLGFYMSLYNLGVNAMVLNNMYVPLRIQLKDFVKEPDYSKLEEAKRPVVNPQLQLTAMYFVQELRRDIPAEEKKNLKELEEEIYVNLSEGRYLTLVRVNDVSTDESAKGRVELPMVKLNNGDSFYPVFTDIGELVKFPNFKIFKVAVMNYEAMVKAIPVPAKGIVINPQGVRLVIPKSQL